MSEIAMEKAYAFAKVDTGTMSDLVNASNKLSTKAHGKIWSYIDASVAYLETALLSVVRLVKHVAMTIISFLGIFTEAGRNFIKDNFHRALVDLSGIVIGLVGVFVPCGAQSLTARQIHFINANILNYGLYSKEQLENYQFANPVVLNQFQNMALAISNDQAKEDYPANEWVAQLNPRSA